MKRGLRIHTQIYIRQVHEVELFSHEDYIWMVYVFFSPFYLGFFSSRLILFYPSSPFLLIPLTLLLLHPIDRLPSPRLLLPAGLLLHPPSGGYRHLRLCPVFSFVVVAWTIHPSSTAEDLTPFKLTINCHSSSHERGTPFSVFMSNSSLISSHGFSAGLFLDSVIFLQEVDGVGRGSMQVISRHGQPFTRAVIE